MKVVCDNCDAVYKIPDEKLTKPVNKATCRSCGNRMLIPRPSGADPDERTLVNPKDDAEATLPAGKAPQTRQEAGLRPPGAARPGTPRPSPPRPSSSGREPEHTTWEQSQAPYSTPAPVRRENAGSAAPAPMREPGYAAPPAYDPSGDLTWALLGTFGAMFGSFMLIADAHFPDIALEAAYRFAAASITLGGVFTSMLVLVLSNRGRQKPSLITALALGAILGLGAAFIGSATRVGAEAYFADEITFGANEGSQGTAVLMEPVGDADPAGGDAGDDEAGDDEAGDDKGDDEDGSADAADAPAPTTSPKPSTRPSSAPAPQPAAAPQPTVVTVPSPSPTAAPSPAPTAPAPEPVAPAPRPAPEPAGDPSLPSQPAFETIDIMLKSNLEVKKCFYGLLKAEGSLPSRVEVRLSIYPSGDVKSVGVKDTRYAGTEFDGCLARSIKNITFPPSNRGGTFTYPFILN